MILKQKPFPTFLQQAKVDERVRLFVEETAGIPPGGNPYRYDQFRMGSGVTKDIQAMWSTPIQGFATTDLRLIRSVTGQCFNVVTIPEDPTPLPVIDLSSWSRGKCGLGVVAWDKAYGEHVVPAMAQYLGGCGLKDLYARNDELSGPMMIESKYGRFFAPLYFYHDSTAVLVAAIPYAETDGRNVVNTVELIDIIHEHGFAEGRAAFDFAQAASEFFTEIDLDSHNLTVRSSRPALPY